MINYSRLLLHNTTLVPAIDGNVLKDGLSWLRNFHVAAMARARRIRVTGAEATYLAWELCGKPGHCGYQILLRFSGDAPDLPRLRDIGGARWGGVARMSFRLHEPGGRLPHRFRPRIYWIEDGFDPGTQVTGHRVRAGKTMREYVSESATTRNNSCSPGLVCLARRSRIPFSRPSRGMRHPWPRGRYRATPALTPRIVFEPACWRHRQAGAEGTHAVTARRPSTHEGAPSQPHRARRSPGYEREPLDHQPGGGTSRTSGALSCGLRGCLPAAARAGGSRRQGPRARIRRPGRRTGGAPPR